MLWLYSRHSIPRYYFVNFFFTNSATPFSGIGKVWTFLRVQFNNSAIYTLNIFLRVTCLRAACLFSFSVCVALPWMRGEVIARLRIFVSLAADACCAKFGNSILWLVEMFVDKLPSNLFLKTTNFVNYICTNIHELIILLFVKVEVLHWYDLLVNFVISFVLSNIVVQLTCLTLWLLWLLWQLWACD